MIKITGHIETFKDINPRSLARNHNPNAKINKAQKIPPLWQHKK
jgi:hypothetical protein